MQKRLRVRLLCLSILLLAPLAAMAQNELVYGGDLAATRAFMADLATLYESRRRGAISVELLTSTDAIKRAATGELDMGGSARPARMDDRQERRVAVYPIVWDALVVVVNRQNPIMNISLDQLVDVYTGRITRWAQLGGEDRAIDVLVHNDAQEGIDHVLAEMLLGDANRALTRTRALPNTQVIEEAVEEGLATLAVTTYSSARKRRLKILSVEGRGVGTDTIQSGTYPLYMPLYVATREDGRNRRAVRDFLRFASGPEAKRVLRRNGVVPYTDGMALASRQFEREQMLERARADD